MRRKELVDATAELNQALSESLIHERFVKFHELLRQSRPDSRSSEASADIFAALNSYSKLAQGFSEPASRIASILGLDRLDDARLWPELLEEPNRVALHIRDITRAEATLPQIVELVRPEALVLIETSAQDRDSKYQGNDVLSVSVLENDQQFSSPERLASVLESVQLFYEVCATTIGEPLTGLSVIACDSGSDKSFDFLGAATVVECVKDLILSMWDKVVYFRERKMSERIKLIAEALPVIETISDLEKEHKMEPEQAEILRRNLGKL